MHLFKNFLKYKRKCFEDDRSSVRPNKFLNAAFRRFEGGNTQNKGKSKHFYREKISIIGIKVKESGI